MKMLSIIVPVYNMESRLDKCLNSLENQTKKDIEVILVNDGSTDSSIKIINKHLKNYPNIYKIIDRENKGISASRNEGIKEASGKYIAFVDSDDYVDLDTYERMYNTIIKNNSDIVVCGIKNVDENDKILKYNYLNNIKITTLKENPKLVHEIDYGPCNKLFKKSLFKNIDFPLNTKYEDLNTILKVFKKAKKIDYINECFYNYYINSNGETKNINNKVYDIFIILNDILASFKNENKELKKEINYLCISKLMDYSEIIASVKNDKLAIDFYLDSIKYLNKKIKKWKFIYLFANNKNLKTTILKLIQINKIMNISHLKVKSKK